ncbi:kinesin light chain-like [Pyrus ussuriensis x Pyrus communis]|uniref:Kinesin light chain-like n=1 Tax=Pyrus ussuriensis x Pyrus communis TaxID=2448454 RepID=A0A5N5GVM3_9ROSA|nr:kinesin light chain-like [Pyrus ussuriensis x Pyrus communis]
MVRSRLGSPSTSHRLNNLDAWTAYSNTLFGPSSEAIVSRASLSRNGPKSELSKEASGKIGSREAGWGLLDQASEGLDRDGD